MNNPIVENKTRRNNTNGECIKISIRKDGQVEYSIKTKDQSADSLGTSIRQDVFDSIMREWHMNRDSVETYTWFPDLTYTSYKDIVDQVMRVRQNAHFKAKKMDYQLARSRGTYLLCCDANGRLDKRDEPYFTKRANPTLAELKEMAQDCLDNGGTYIGIEGGYDGVVSIRNDDYDPMIEEWGVNVSCKDILAL